MMRKISTILMRDTHGDLVTIKITKKQDLTITEKIIIMSSESESEASISEHFCFVISKVVRTFICILKCPFFMTFKLCYHIIFQFSFSNHINQNSSYHIRVSHGKETKRRKKQPYKEILFY